MTNEDIHKLADEYADKECAMSRHTGKKLKQLHEDKIVEFFDVFGFLIERFCIVPRSKVKEEYTEVSNTYWQKYSEESQMDSRRDVYERGYNVGIMNVIEDIFGKDMFEEEGK